MWLATGLFWIARFLCNMFEPRESCTPLWQYSLSTMDVTQPSFIICLFFYGFESMLLSIQLHQTCFTVTLSVCRSVRSFSFWLKHKKMMLLPNTTDCDRWLKMTWMEMEPLYLSTSGEKHPENHVGVTWSKNPLTGLRCLDGYVAKIPAVAFFPTTTSSPWLKSCNASGGRI